MKTTLEKIDTGIYECSSDSLDNCSKEDYGIIASADLIYFMANCDIYYIIKNKLIPLEGNVTSKQINEVLGFYRNASSMKIRSLSHCVATSVLLLFLDISVLGQIMFYHVSSAAKLLLIANLILSVYALLKLTKLTGLVK